MKKTNYKMYEKKILGCVFRVIAKNDLKLTLTKNNIWFDSNASFKKPPNYYY